MRVIRFIPALLALHLLAASVDPDPAKVDVIQPAKLAARISTGAEKLTILYVGYPALYRKHHITGAILAGPVSKPKGLERLKEAVAKLPRHREVIIYCGCCPWDHCPNIRPAYRVLHQMGFTRVKVVSIANNMNVDWALKGYPVVEGQSQ